ncbi:uncharacterized protein DDB_G0283697-like [Syngnathus acus]|uniref:uncharacterized protein DDB_G0283697-like n=1 Tax=Syngnathus acus TaxID=161584 RepID=UPI001885AAD0|nr:uncharacterized protein DDB_G0283697-like [Syngnathus acus]
MDGQGDGDHNGPNRYRTSIPLGDLPPTDSDDDVDDDNDDHDDVGGDEEDMDSVFLMHLFVNHYMKFFVHPQASLQQANADNENIVRDFKIEKSNADDLIDHEDELDVTVEVEAELEVSHTMEEEEEPQPGPSRNRTRDDEEEEEMRSSSRYFRWWHEFDNSSDGSTDLDNDEQDPVPGGAKKRSRDDLDGNLRLQGDLSLMTLSGHHIHSFKNTVNEERGAAKVGDFHFGAQETMEDTQSRENYDKENKSGKKRFKR